MPAITDLTARLEGLAAAIPDLNLGGEQEKYSTRASGFQNQVETDDPSERIVNECLAYFVRFKIRAA